MMEKPAAIFALSALIIIAMCSAAAGDTVRGCGKGTRQIRLGEVTLSIGEASATGDYLLKFSKGEEELFSCECAFKTHEPRIVSNTPVSNCSTLLAYCYSGGAHCCTTLFIATQCDSGNSLDMVDLGHTGEKVKFTHVDGVRGRAIMVSDWQLAYYVPEDSQFQLSFADSPVMTRLLIFDNGHWRADRVGEFSLFYSRLLHETVRKARTSARRHQPELTASLAMKAAYYDLMSGKPIAEAAEVLNQLCPIRCGSKGGNVIRDIYRAVSEFNPVETIR